MGRKKKKRRRLAAAGGRHPHNEANRASRIIKEERNGRQNGRGLPERGEKEPARSPKRGIARRGIPVRASWEWKIFLPVRDQKRGEKFFANREEVEIT